MRYRKTRRTFRQARSKNYRRKGSRRTSNASRVRAKRGGFRF